MMTIEKLFFLYILAVYSALIHAKQDAPWVGKTLNGLACTGKSQGYGPFDYRNKSHLAQEIKLVEGAHFTKEVENLISGHRGTLEGDIDYTLRAWPNHPRALLSIIRLQIKINKKISQYKKIDTPPECYLQRAIHFTPQDPTPYALYGYYLKKIGHLQDAIEYYEKALELSPNNPKHAYSFSLLLIDLKHYDDAYKYAKIAYAYKNAPKQLKNKLIKLGVWKD